MKRYCYQHFLCIIVLFLSSGIYGQPLSNSDSLKQLVAKAENPSRKIELLNRLAASYYYKDPQKMVDYAEEALALARSVEDEKNVANVLITLGAVYGSLYEAEKGRACLEEAFVIQEKLGDKEGAIKALNNIGVSYYFETNYVKAIEYYLRAIKEEELHFGEVAVASSYANVGLIWFELKSYEEAEAYFLKATKCAQEHQDTESLLPALSSLAITYYRTAQYDKALETVDSLQFYADSLQVPFGIANAKQTRSYTYFKQGKLEEALRLAKESLELDESIGNPRGIIKTIILKAQIEEALGRHNSAKASLDFILKDVESLQDKELLSETYQTLYEVYKAHGETEDALMAHERYVLYRDSMLDEDKSKAIAAMQIKFESEQKEHQIESLEQAAKIKDLQLQQATLNLTILLVVLVVLVLIGVLLYFVFKQRNIRLEQKAQAIEQKLLRAQMNPHFIFNALTAIQEYMLNEDSFQAGIYLSKFSKLMRQILENSRSEYILLEQEVNMLENYLSLHLLLQKERFDYEITVDEAIDVSELAVPPMFAQPFVENAIKHGIANLDRKGKINIHFKLEQEQVVLEILDNGVGLNKTSIQPIEKRQQHQSLATQITKERIDIFKQVYKTQISFEVQALTEGTKVMFRLPFQYQ